ncbi:MAG: ABC transporter substrate-binding protein [Pseudomonadota bacterium]
MEVRNKVFMVIVLLGVMCFINNSVSQAKEVRGVTDDSIKIGAVLDQTGPAASVTVPFTRALKNYFRFVNDGGGIHGRKINLIVEDDRYSIAATIAAFKKVVYKDKIFAYIGPGSGSFVNVLWKKMQKEKLPTITLPMPEICVKPYKRYIFITSDTYEGQIRVLVDYMIQEYKLKEPRIGLVYPDTEVGKIDTRAALPRLKKYNLEPVTKEVLMAGSIDASSQVMNLKRYKVNAVLNVGSITSTTVTLLRELRKYGLKIPTFNSWACMVLEDLNLLGEAASQAYSVHANSPWYGKGPGVEKMREITLKYHPGTEKPYRGPLYTHGWVISTIATEGFRRAGRDLDAEVFINALETIKDYDTGGLCNPITFSSKSHKGGDSWKIYKADPVGKKYVAVTDWRKSE